MKSECVVCETKDITVRELPHMNMETAAAHPGQKYAVCDLCSSTWAWRAYCYPTRYDAPLFSTVCYIGNKILRAVERIYVSG